MKRFVQHDSDGMARFVVSVHDGEEPSRVEGLTATEIDEDIGVPPFDGAQYHVPSKRWVDARTIGQAKAEKWQKIKAARDDAEFGGFDWDGSRFDSNQKSQARILGAVQMAALAQDYSVDWTLADNTVRTLSASDLSEVGIALAAHVAAQHAKARAMRQRIDAAATIEQLKLIAWDM